MKHVFNIRKYRIEEKMYLSGEMITKSLKQLEKNKNLINRLKTK